MQRQRRSSDARRTRQRDHGRPRRLRIAEPEPFRIEVQPERERVWVIPVGEVDLAVAPVLEDSLRQFTDAGAGWIGVDLGRVSFLDCAGLRVLIGASLRAGQTATRLEVLHARGQVARLLALAGVDLPIGVMTPHSRSDAVSDPIVAPHDATGALPQTDRVTRGPWRGDEPLVETGRRA